MAIAEPRTISQWSACTSPSANDLVLCQGNALANTFKVSVTDFFGNNDVDFVVSVAASLIISNTDTPANSTVGGFANQSIWFDDDFIYCSVSNGHIRRVAIVDFP